MIQEDILTPLGMSDSYVALPGTAADAPHGLNTLGRQAANWEMDGYAPAGSIRSTAADMAKFVAHVRSIGLPSYAWQHDPKAVWHNGGTGGFQTMLAIDPATNSAAFVATDSKAHIEKLGVEMLSWKH